MYLLVFVQKKPIRETSGCLWRSGSTMGEPGFSGFSKAPVGAIRDFIVFGTVPNFRKFACFVSRIASLTDTPGSSSQWRCKVHIKCLG